MKIAVTYENGNVFQHFGHCGQFKIYEVDDRKIVVQNVVDTNGSGHGALAGFLKNHGVDTLICGGIGGGAKMALAEASIEVFPGVSGSADDAVNALLAGSLRYDPNTQCAHHANHDHDHNCHSHDSQGGGCHSHQGQSGGCHSHR